VLRNKVWGVKQPIGTVSVRIRDRGRGYAVRFIKVAMDGPPQQRWKRYARHLWEQANGPIPEGMRVVHVDNDLLNDDLDNLELMTAADVLGLAHVNDPEMSEANFKAMRKGTIRHNKLRAQINRARTWYPDRWYTIDLDRGLICDTPHRSEWMAYDVLDVEFPNAKSRLAPEASALGWPGLGRMNAAALFVLLDGPLRFPQIAERLDVLFTERRWKKPESWESVRSNSLSKLRRKGYLMPVEIRGVNELSAIAIGQQKPGANVTAVKGSTIKAEKLDRTYTRVGPKWRPRASPVPDVDSVQRREERQAAGAAERERGCQQGRTGQPREPGAGKHYREGWMEQIDLFKTPTKKHQGAYRFTLQRHTRALGGTVLFCMLNPSTADDRENDPTIRRCIGFAERWGYSKLRVVNLFAARSTDPKGLRAMEDPIGEGNDDVVAAEIEKADLLVAGWGASGGMVKRKRAFLKRFGKHEWMCLGQTVAGHPKHPLYLAKTTELVVFNKDLFLGGKK